MNIITVGQMQQLTGRLDNITGAASTERLKFKRLAQLYWDAINRFDVKKDKYAKQLCDDILNAADDLVSTVSVLELL